MNPASLVVFVIFAALQLGVYIAVRRSLYSLSLLAAAGVFFSIILMALFSLFQGNLPLYAVLFGIVVGGLFSIAVIAMAAFFRRNTGALADAAYLRENAAHSQAGYDDLTPSAPTMAAMVGGEDAE